MGKVKAKKYLGQHFLKDESIALRIVESLSSETRQILEIGPGMGVLTKYLIERYPQNLQVVEIDSESVAYLKNRYPELPIIEGDFLALDISSLVKERTAIIGNFPYNISSQILFKVYENHEQVDEVVGMFQKEVAERIAAKPGNKTYGILSVLLRLFYDIEYLFTVDESVFDPPPKVKSAVIQLKKKQVIHTDFDISLFTKVVKAGFNQRRKMLRNALSAFGSKLADIEPRLLNQRAEQLSLEEFIILTKAIQQIHNSK